MSHLLDILTRSRCTGFTTAMLKMIPENGIVIVHSLQMKKVAREMAKELGRTDIEFFGLGGLEHARGLDVYKRCIMIDNAALWLLAKQLDDAESQLDIAKAELAEAQRILKQNGLYVTKLKSPHNYHPGVI